MDVNCNDKSNTINKINLLQRLNMLYIFIYAFSNYSKILYFWNGLFMFEDLLHDFYTLIS